MYFQTTGRRVTIEYTLLAGVNDSPAQVCHHYLMLVLHLLHVCLALIWQAASS